MDMRLATLRGHGCNFNETYLEVIEGELDAGGACDGQQVEHGVGRPTQGHHQHLPHRTQHDKTTHIRGVSWSAVCETRLGLSVPWRSRRRAGS